MDNYYKNCPPRSYSKGLTNYKNPAIFDEVIRNNNNIIRNDDYRLFLQMNGNKLMDTEWMHLRQTQSCWNNACVHDMPLRQDPRTFVEERDKANLLFKSTVLPQSVKCNQYADYRMTKTPLSNYNYTGCNGECTSMFNQNN